MDDTTAARKRCKEQENSHIRLRGGKNTSDEARAAMDEAEIERLRELFAKTEEMKAVSESKNREVTDQFRSLRERLDNNSGFLQQIKKNIQNIKFSYERNVTDLQKLMEANREDVEKQMDEIRNNIDKLQTKAAIEKKWTSANSPQNYLEAFNRAVESLQQCSGD